MWKGHPLRLQARSGKHHDCDTGFLSAADLDSTPMWIPSRAGNTFVSRDLTLTFVGEARFGGYEAESYRIEIGDILDLSIVLRPAKEPLQTPADANVHFSLLFNKILCSDKVKGLDGQSFKGDDSEAVQLADVSKILKGRKEKFSLSPEEFEALEILLPNCKVGVFHKQFLANFAKEDEIVLEHLMICFVPSLLLLCAMFSKVHYLKSLLP